MRITDIFAASGPSLPIFLKGPLGPNTGLHTDLVKTGSFGQVQDVHLDPMRLLLGVECDVFVDNFEIVPLGVTLGVHVVLEPEVVFDIAYFGDLPEVAVLESGVKDQDVLLIRDVQSLVPACKVSLWLESWHVPEKQLILLTSEVSLPSLISEQVPLDVPNLILTEQDVRLDLPWLELIKVLVDLVTALEFGVRIVDQDATHFFPGLVLILFFLLFLILHLRSVLHVIDILKLLRIILLSKTLRRVRHDHFAAFFRVVCGRQMMFLVVIRVDLLYVNILIIESYVRVISRLWRFVIIIHRRVRLIHIFLHV